MTCDKATYVFTSRTEDGVWEFLATCDGMPDCGFEIDVAPGEHAEVISDTLVSFDITSEEMADYDRRHREFTR